MWYSFEELKETNYLRLISEMLERDKKRLEYSKNDPDTELYSSFDLDKLYKIDFPLFEPRTAFATPVRYFQDLYINNEKWPFVWRHDSTRAISIVNGELILLSKHTSADEKTFLFYLLIKFGIIKDKIETEKDEIGNARISFSGDKEVIDLKTGEKKNINIQFNFLQKPFHKTQKQRAKGTAMYKHTYRGGGVVQAASKFEDYIITVPHFSPHPYLLNEFEKLGFTKRSDMQKAVFDYLKEYL